LTTKVGRDSGIAIATRVWHAALWRAWMVVRAVGRGIGVAAKGGYLGLAFVAIGALGVGVLTITIGGLIADVLVATGMAPGGSSRTAVASVATMALCAGSLAAVGLNRLAASGRSPTDAIRRTARGPFEAFRGFREEWATASEAWANRARRRNKRRVTAEDRGPGRTADGQIAAGRIWLVGPGREGGAALIAPISRLQWEQPVMTAFCDARLARSLIGGRYQGHPEPAPAVECVCGVYALKRAMWPAPRHRAPIASGMIALSGRVIEGSRGFRAEHAELAGPLRIDLVCAGEVEGELWTAREDGNWQPVLPNPCPFGPVTLAAGSDEYVGLCRIHADRVAHLLESLPQISPLALQAQMELRYGVDVAIKSRAAQWT
jgi:hypothetical protein